MVLKLSLLVIITTIAAPLIIWGCDVLNDRKHVVTVISTTLFLGEPHGATMDNGLWMFPLAFI